MSSQQYTVYNGATPKTFTLDTSATMADVRQALGSYMATTDNFLYENPITGLKTVLTPVSSERTARLRGCQFPPVPSQGVENPIIQVVSTSNKTPTLLGTTPESGYVHSGPLFGVRARLNETDPVAIKNNKGMFQPVMLENVISANPDHPLSFTYAMICQKGAIVEFDISCWGAAGFGFAITSDMSAPICPGLVVPFTDNFGRQSVTTMRRYASKEADTIQIEANAALGIAKTLDIEYSTIIFRGWSLDDWTSDGHDYHSDLSIPTGPQGSFAVGNIFKDGGFQPGPPAGSKDIPGGTTQSGSPTGGPPSNQQIGIIGSYHPGSIPTTRAGGLVGAIQLYCLVFDNDEDAKNIIKVLNAGDQGFGS